MFMQFSIQIPVWTFLGVKTGLQASSCQVHKFPTNRWPDDELLWFKSETLPTQSLTDMSTIYVSKYCTINCQKQRSVISKYIFLFTLFHLLVILFSLFILSHSVFFQGFVGYHRVITLVTHLSLVAGFPGPFSVFFNSWFFFRC